MCMGEACTEWMTMSYQSLHYYREGIDWADIEWVDNVECLDLVEKVLLLSCEYVYYPVPYVY